MVSTDGFVLSDSYVRKHCNIIPQDLSKSSAVPYIKNISSKLFVRESIKVSRTVNKATCCKLRKLNLQRKKMQSKFQFCFKMPHCASCWKTDDVFFFPRVMFLSCRAGKVFIRAMFTGVSVIVGTFPLAAVLGLT